MTKREPLRPNKLECVVCGKTIGRFSKVYAIPNVEGDVCRACEFDSKLIPFNEKKAIERVKHFRRTGMRVDRILPELRKWMRPPTHARLWENAGAWNDFDVHDYMTRNWSWCE